MKRGFQTTDGAPEQFVLYRFDTAPFCCVIDNCETCTSNKLEKCVHSIGLCSTCRNLYWTKSIRGWQEFFFSFEETAAESYRLLREVHGEYAPSLDTCERWFRRFRSGDF